MFSPKKGKGLCMNRGMSLVELLLSLSLSTIVILVLGTMFALFTQSYRETRDGWYCMQSLRSACAQIDADVKQCALLLPQDLKVVCSGHALFVAGAPVTSGYPGLSLQEKTAPPYYSVAQEGAGSSIGLDSVDINGDSTPDYWADLGIITDSGAYVISHTYSRGSISLSLTSPHRIRTGDRSVPSNHYELKEDGLYRNAQPLAEAITAFDTRMAGKKLTIHLLASHNDEKRDISYTYHLQ
jgi:hypothetical protein